MRFRYIYISRLIFQLLRPNYAIRYDYDGDEQPERLNSFYRLILCILCTLSATLEEYYHFRLKWYMLSGCEPTYGQVQRVMQKLYDDRVQIVAGNITVNDTYLYMEPTPARYLYVDGIPAVFWGESGAYANYPTIRIPQELYDDTILYNNFIADLNVLVPFNVPYVIQTF